MAASLIYKRRCRIARSTAEDPPTRIRRPGKKVRGVEDGIIASLGKLIADEEQKAAAAAAAAGAPGRRAKQPSSPAPDSARLKGTSPGAVAKKSIGTHSNWGDLDPKE